MGSKDNTLDFLSYIKNNLSEHTLSMLYDANKVKYDRCQLYSDFVCSLLHIVFDTYMGDEFTNKEERVNHFNWCWNKNIDNFKDENIHFKSLDELKDYFKEFLIEVYYNIEDKETKPYIKENLISLWEYLFDFKKPKTQADVDSFIEIYNIFEKSLKK